MSDLQKLKENINNAITQISNRKTTPKKSGIGRMLVELNNVCPDTYVTLLAEYKPVAHNFFKEKNITKKKPVISAIEKTLLAIEKNLNFDIEDFDESGKLKTDVFEKAIDDASARIEGKRTKKIPVIVKDPTIPKVRNRQTYIFNGNIYGKGPLALAIVQCYVDSNPDVDYIKLKTVFPDELLKSYGIFKKLDDAQEASKKRKRYFLKNDQLISIKDCQIAVCNQFTSNNIGAFIEKAKSMGYEIKEEDV